MSFDNEYKGLEVLQSQYQHLGMISVDVILIIEEVESNYGSM